MDMAAILAAVTGLSGVAGGFIGGRRSANTQAMSVATSTVEMLEVQVELLTNEREERSNMISDLRSRIEVLESLVTQRAEVDRVKIVVDRIAAKVGA